MEQMPAKHIFDLIVYMCDWGMFLLVQIHCFLKGYQDFVSNTTYKALDFKHPDIDKRKAGVYFNETVYTKQDRI